MLNKFKKQLAEKKEIYLRIKVRPCSSKNEVKEVLDDETIKINVAAPALKDKANLELIKFLAKEFDISKNNVRISSGAKERIKLIYVKK